MFESIIKKQTYYSIPTLHMIAGIQIEAIRPTDLHLRFIILQKILSHKDRFTAEAQDARNRNQYILARYSNLIKELTRLEAQMHNENNEYTQKEQDVSLNLQEMDREYQRCLMTAEATVTQYERKMLQTWRDGITQNEQKEKIGRNQSESRATNNKNLMLLTSQLLKKERQTKHIVQNEQNTMLSEIQKIRNTLHAKKHFFQQNINKMREAYLSQKQKLQKITNLQNGRRDSSISKQVELLHVQIKRYNDALSQQKEQSEAVVRELQTILNDLQAKCR